MCLYAFWSRFKNNLSHGILFQILFLHILVHVGRKRILFRGLKMRRVMTALQPNWQCSIPFDHKFVPLSCSFLFTHILFLYLKIPPSPLSITCRRLQITRGVDVPEKEKKRDKRIKEKIMQGIIINKKRFISIFKLFKFYQYI